MPKSDRTIGTRARFGPAGCSAGRRRGAELAVVASLALASLLGGCAFTAQVAATQPSAVTQQLLARSLERALSRLDVKRFAGQQATADVYVQAGNQAFVKELVIAWLGEQGIRVAPVGGTLALKVFAPVYGTDHAESLLGIPAFQAPVVAIPVPEIALFKQVRNRGQAEVEIYAFDEKTNEFVAKTPVSAGQAKYDNYTVLLIVNFTVTDIDKPPAE
jgi:hypothetical protein